MNEIGVMRRTRFLLLAAAWLALAACHGARPAPPPAPVPAGPPPQAPPVSARPIAACVVQDERMAMLNADYDPVSGDTTVRGRPFREAYPTTAAFAGAAAWFVGNEAVVHRQHRYYKYELPRVLAVDDVVATGEFRGVSVFVEPAADRDWPQAVYLPVSPDCMFQPYQNMEDVGAVRG